MGCFFIKFTIITILLSSQLIFGQEFQGIAEYAYKAQMELGRWGERMSEAQKKQIAERLKNRLEKKYILTFNKVESVYDEHEKLDAISGATDSWGKNFTPGKQYKSLKGNLFLQEQEFYGKTFLIRDTLLQIKWQIEAETKQIGNYTCHKATAKIPSSDLAFWEFSWNQLREQTPQKKPDTINGANTVNHTNITAWYAPTIPVSHGPSEFWGLPGLILEVSSGNTTILCSKIVINPTEKTKIQAPKRGTEINKEAYKTTVLKKMKEFRDNRVGRS